MRFRTLATAILLCAKLAFADPIALSQHSEVHTRPAFSPGGQYLLVGAGTSKNPIFNLWDVPKGKLLQTIPAPEVGEPLGGEPVTASFSADGKTFAVLFLYSKTRKVRVQVWREGQLLKEISGDNWSPDVNVSLSPDGSMLLEQAWDFGDSSDRSSQRVVLLSDLKKSRTLKNGSFREWSPDNKLLVFRDQKPVKEDPFTGQKLGTHSLPFRDDENVKYGKSGWPLLGGTNLGLRFARRMGKGKAELFDQSNNQVLASWPQLYGDTYDPKKRFYTIVTAEGVIFIDLKASDAAHALKTL